ncbi:zinc ribbon domain-containing protein [Pseudochelatococcus lubricantis]|nr:zinc ribbon domain-containing protein [Pseudochelatococcus lubricantis]
MISATLIGCSTARNKGTCDNRVNIRRDELESRVLNALRNRMLDPKIFPPSAMPIRRRPIGCAWRRVRISTRRRRRSDGSTGRSRS